MVVYGGRKDFQDSRVLEGSVIGFFCFNNYLFIL